MSTYRNALPQLGEQLFLTDGGMETTLVFKDGIDLPCFAACTLMETEAGVQRLKDYFDDYLPIALNHHCGFVLETPTWRANPFWGAEIGYDATGLDKLNRDCVKLMEGIREQYAHEGCPIVVSGCIGPRYDGYSAAQQLTAEQAYEYHRLQIATFADTAADMVSAMTLNYPAEAIGITKAAQAYGIPVSISFTTETDGRLPDGMSLGDAIAAVDAATDNGPAYYMINCAHPDHFSQALDQPWAQRIRAIRANASRLSHAELDEAEVLDAGNPEEFGQLYRKLRESFPQLTILGGCCGTDHRHIGEIGTSCCAHTKAA